MNQDVEPVVENAALESMLPHARALADFLVFDNDRPRKDGILRTDFAAQWRPDPADAAERINAGREVINKHLAHLTWTRVSDTSEWDYSHVAADIVAVAEAWCEHIDEDVLFSGLRSDVQIAKTKLPSTLAGPSAP